MNGSSRTLWAQTCFLGSVLLACSICDFACGGGGGGSRGGGHMLPVAVSAAGIPMGSQAIHYATSSAEIYSPVSESFSPTAGSMQQARAASGVVQLQDETVLFTGGIITGGPGESATNSAEIYNPTLKTFTFTSNPMLYPRAFHTITLLSDGTVLLAGGAGTTTTTTFNANYSAEIYNPFVQKFLSTGSLVTARMSAGSALLPNGSVLVAGGVSAFDASGSGTPLAPLSSIEIYNPQTRTFTPGGTMQSARTSPIVAALNSNMILIAGGDAQNTAELYNPTTQTTMFTANILTSNQPLSLEAFAFSQDVNLVITGGAFNSVNGEEAVSGVEQYTVANSSFSGAGNLMDARFSHQMTTLLGSGILVTGGLINEKIQLSNGTQLQDPTFDPNAYLCSAELYT